MSSEPQIGGRERVLVELVALVALAAVSGMAAQVCSPIPRRSNHFDGMSWSPANHPAVKSGTACFSAYSR